MRFEITFDSNAVQQQGYTMQAVCSILKDRFAQYNFSCTDSGEPLIFEARKDKDAYSNSLCMILRLSRTDWFLNTASSCLFYERENKCEDILAEAKAKKLQSSNRKPESVQNHSTQRREKRPMRFEITFNPAAVQQQGYTMQNICNTLKDAFAQYYFSCTDNGESLIFEARKDKDAYSNSLCMILRLSRTDWFLNTASSCLFYQEENRREDILAEAKARKQQHSETT